MKLLLATLLSFANIAPAAPTSLLVRVDLAAGLGSAAVSAAGHDVLYESDGWCLVRTGDTAGRLESLDCQVLDQNPELKHYVFVFVEPGFDRAQLAQFGNVLTADRLGVLLRTTPDGVQGLNRLPVELYAIPLRPQRREQALAARPRVPAARSVSDSLIWTLVNRVSEDSLESYLCSLIGFTTRYATTYSCRLACDWMRGRLAAYRCDSTYLDTFNSSYAPNVVGVRVGRTDPQHIFVVSGHIDNTSEYPDSLAPGSDDNASGIGFVLEVARAFAEVDLASTVWFVGFSAEEQGLVGSDDFVYTCLQRGDSIVTAINSDMISYGRDDSLTVVHSSTLPATESLALFFLAQADTFTSLQAKDTVIDWAVSDHYSFWKYGYLAIRGRYHDRTPMYHTIFDTIGPLHYANCGTNNLPLYTEMVKATVATLAKWAGATQNTGTAEPGQVRAPAETRIMPTVGRAPVLVRLSSAAAELSVYSAAGRLVRRLGRGESLTWDGRDRAGAAVGPGVYYFCAASAPARFTLVE